MVEMAVIFPGSEAEKNPKSITFAPIHSCYEILLLSFVYATHVYCNVTKQFYL